MTIKHGKLITWSFLTIALAIALAISSSQKPSRTPVSSPVVPGAQPALVNTANQKTYKDGEYGFSVRYPSDYQLQVGSSSVSAYGKEFLFANGDSVPLSLQIIDLAKYLPTTNTPTLPEYLKTLSSFPKFTEANIAGKSAYEYLTCGRAACSQEVVFIHKDILYDFSIVQPGAKRNAISFENSPPKIRAIIESLTFL